MYDGFDKGHRREHADTVIEQSLTLADYYDVAVDMVYAIAAYHDTGLSKDRASHHLESGRIVRTDAALRQWFSEKDIETMAEAVEDHRASSKTEPRSIYGKIVAEADRQIDVDTILRRAIQFGFAHYPALSAEEHILRATTHLKEKYGKGGYLRLLLPESPNRKRLDYLQTLIADEPKLKERVTEIFREEYLKE